MSKNLKDLQSKYEEGYRCIYKEEKDGLTTLHLKDFAREKSHTVSSNENMEIGAMENFLDDIELEKKAKGHDIICTD
ncbi:MAG: hypothetical protein BEN19_02865 [Epulopiscium sp. Nuni2H_MBin003]|nr:MAG: hypothetical protein BEN19_02865 [Epulopiscium sp. Nuni2H_MBin003]